MVRAAATVLFSALKRRNTHEISIAELAERPQYGFTASAVNESVGPKLVRITDLQDGKIDWVSVPFCKCEDPEKYTLGEDDILFARTGATTGKTYLVRDPQLAVFASYLIRLRPKPNVEPGYLYSFFQSDNYWSQISEEKEGSAQPNVNGEKLASLKIPIVHPEMQRAIAEFLLCVRRRQDGDSVELPELPLPLAEQRRIVARIEELATQVQEARTLRQQAAGETEALGGAEAARIFRAALEKISQPLKSVATLERGKFSHRPRNEPRFFGGTHPWIQIGEIENSNKFIRNWTETLNDDGLAISKKFARGTVLISIAATIGAVGILDFDCCIPDSIVGVTPYEGTNPEFIYYCAAKRAEEH